jgi:MraZ protein
VASPGLGFLGTSTHTVDKKNRVFLAKRFQDLIPRDADGLQTAVLSPGREGCIWLSTAEGFAALARHFEQQNPLDPDSNVDDARDFYEYVSEVSLDSSGRLLLSPDLRALVGIADEVVMVGMRTRVELWPVEAWARRERGHYSPNGGSKAREGKA